MARQELLPGTTLGVIRGQINSNFTELYDADLDLANKDALFASLTGNWQSTYLTVSALSANWNVGGGGGGASSSNYLPLSGGTLSGPLSSTSTVTISGARAITSLPTDTIPVHYVTVLPQSAYDALSVPRNPNILYFII